VYKLQFFFAFIQVTSVNQTQVAHWLGSIVVRSRTSDSQVSVRVTPAPLLSNNLEQVIYTVGAQANSAFCTFGVGK